MESKWIKKVYQNMLVGTIVWANNIQILPFSIKRIGAIVWGEFYASLLNFSKSIYIINNQPLLITEKVYKIQ